MDASEDKSKWLEQRLARLKTNRVNFDSRWDRIARLVLPSAVGFQTSYFPGTRQDYDIFDSTAQLALPRFAAAIDTLVTPQTTRWHTLVPKRKMLKQSMKVRRFLDDFTDLLFSVRYSPRASFASRVNEVYTSVGAFGNGALYVHDARPGIQYISVHLAEIWFDEDAQGRIDTAFWEHEYTARQAVQKFGAEKLPPDIVADADRNPQRTVKFCKAVYPRADRDPKKRDAKNMPFASCTFLVGKDSVIVEESGYRTFPFAVARDVTSPREIYARGAAERCLADNLTLQEMAKTGLRYGQLVTDPPWLAVDADSMDPFAARPGAVNYGYLGADGVPRVQPLRPQGDPGFGLELMDQRRQAINNAFLVNLFQVLVENTKRMTATEVMQLVQEKGALLGPLGGRLRTEFLGPIIEREIDILFNAGVVSPRDIPEELVEAGGEIDFEYDSPLTRAMRAEEGVGILRTLEFVSQAATQVAAADQDRARKIVQKVNYERALDRIAELNGAPADIMFTDDEVADMEAGQQQQVEAQQMLQAAPVIADTVKTLAEAQNVAGNQTAVI